MPKASIIIPCYNLGQFVEEAVQSALNQTYTDKEVIVIDDGSTDPHTVAKLDELALNTHICLIRTENQGVARARNYAISRASGEYILPLDADDRILPHYLEAAITILESDHTIGFVGTHYRIFGDRQAEVRPDAYRLPDLLVENVVPIASVYRRECWEKTGGYCPDLNSIEDWDLWIGILGQGYTAHVLPELHFEYRVRPNSNLAYLRDPDVYQARLALLYQRHLPLFEHYNAEVLRAKDRQFANIHSYAMYLEQQARNWQQVAEQRQQIINELERSQQLIGHIQVVRTTWKQRVQQVWNEPTLSAKLMRIARYGKRFIRQLFQLRSSKSG